MGAVLEALGGEAPARASLPENSHTSKLRALWISAWCLGVVRNRSDDALAAFIRRQAGIDAARWATPAQTAAAIEALKDWMERDGGVDWSPYARDGASSRRCGGSCTVRAPCGSRTRARFTTGSSRGPATSAATSTSAPASRTA